jgi:hypothetical protein
MSGILRRFCSTNPKKYDILSARATIGCVYTIETKYKEEERWIRN